MDSTRDNNNSNSSENQAPAGCSQCFLMGVMYKQRKIKRIAARMIFERNEIKE
jgi:hypothetical protein